MTKVQKNRQSKITSLAWEIFKSGTENWSKAMKAANQQIKALETIIKAGKVTFWKQPKKGTDEVEVTTRQVKPLSEFDYTPKGPAKEGKRSYGYAKFVDLDKLALTGNIAASIISFQLIQVL